MTILNFSEKFKFLYTCALYDNFFEMVQSINLCKKEKQLTGKNYIKCIKKAHYKVFLIQTFLFVLSFICTMGALLTNHSSNLLNFALCNWFYMEGVSPNHYFWLVVNLYLGIYIAYLLYFCNDGITFTVIYDICKHSKSYFFIQPNQRLFWQNIHIVQFVKNRLIPFGKFYLISVQIAASKLGQD